MTTNGLPKSLLIPNLPPAQQELFSVMDAPGGKRYHMHPVWHSFFSQLTTALQFNLSQEGIIVPKQTALNIAKLNVTNPDKFGATIYDNDNHVAKINLNGVFKTITTS